MGALTVTGAIWVAGLIAFLVAGAELLARYRDDPVRALWSVPAFAYEIVNGLTGVLAAWWIAEFFPTAVAKPGATGIDPLKLAVVAGFGALVVLRSSLMKLRIANGQDISVGPAVIVEQLLSVIDRSVDRHLARRRAGIATELSEHLVFERDNAALVSLCLVLLQNPTPAEEQEMTAVSRALAGRTDLAPRVKKMMLLLALLGVVGEQVLRQAVKALQVPVDGPEPPAVLPPLANPPPVPPPTA
jgi:hypothetical protein